MTDKTKTTWGQKIDGGSTMATMWEGFTEGVIPYSQETSIQYREMQKAFYAGAFCLFNWFMVQLDEGEEPTDSDMDRVSAISDEIHSYFLAMMREHGGMQ